MQWSEVRALFPNTFVLMEDQRSYTENGEWHVDEVAVIRPLHDGKEALMAVRAAHGSTFVYHTKHPEIVMPIRSKPAYRGAERET
ncbi:hypothetical protein [Sulfobacillus harzensis]|uniref:Uncharacterized protein n=1 Tax=Sulfobacillus harzensis TaxID=2729629 RepID=A0A7Y0L8N6_9FIRM|nr:hypothetical protein [Sulfobacillus harzensis]NMP25191.1 hypothetical protein [Sulfobacillus harzensis]